MTRPSDSRTRLLTVGKLGQLTGVTADTVRFYERAGLLSNAQRSASGYRPYGAADVDRVRFIRRARDLGFSLEEVAQLLALSDGQGDPHIRELAEKRLSEMDRRLEEITRVREALLILLESVQSGDALKGLPIIRALVPPA
jgi:MerR family transcriptional regulator, copper efflux regulator